MQSAHQISVCPVCQLPPGKQIKSPDPLSGTPYTISFCLKCERGWTNDVPSEAEICYPPRYYGGPAGRFSWWAEYIISQTRKNRAHTLARAIPREGTILDVGCGRGLMLETLLLQGRSVLGVELTESASSLASSRGVPVKVAAELDDLNLPEKSFAAITYFHSLEHLFDPTKSLREAHRLLRQNGILIVEVPNFASWQARLAGPTWLHLDPPRHLHHFTSNSLRREIEQAGFQTIKVQTFSFEQGVFGAWQTLLNRVSKRSNQLYSSMRVDEAASLFWTRFLLSSPLLPIAFVLELTAGAFGKGGVIRLTATPRV